MLRASWRFARLRGWEWAAGCVVLLALCLRLFRLDGQSFWYDEGISVTLAPRSLEVITLSAAADIHPPLYYYLLHFWVQVAGTTEFAARFLSVFEGVLLVALVYVIGRRLFSAEIGVISSFLAATSPFLIYYSQEARMYSQAALLAGLSMYSFMCLVDAPKPYRGRGRWTAYLVATVLAVYSNYYVFTVPLLQNVYTAAWLVLTARGAKPGERWAHARDPLLSWTAAQFAILVAYVPWFAASYRQLLGWPSISEPFGLTEMIARLFRVFSFGLSWDAAATTSREMVFAALAASAFLYIVTGPRERSVRSLAIAVLYLSVPVLAMYVASLRRPMYNPKFLLLAAPAYCLLLGVGIGTLRELVTRALHTRALQLKLGRPAVLALSLLVAVGCLFATTSTTARSLQAYYFDPKYARDDYRGLAQYVEKRWQAGDAVVLNAPGQVEIFSLYFGGEPGSVYPLPGQRPMVAETTEADLSRIKEKHGRVWLVLWATRESDPDSYVEHWLDSQMYRSDSRWFGSVRLVQYASENRAGGRGREQGNLEFGERILLRSHGPLSWEGEPESTIPVSLAWEGKQQVDERYKVFVHLLDDGDYLWGQHDAEPGGGFRLTTDWKPGEPVEDRHGLTVATGTPPGTYRIEVGLYDPNTGKRLAIRDSTGKEIGDRLLFGEMRVRAKAFAGQIWESTLIPQRQPAHYGPLELVGYGLTRLGEEKQQTEFSSSDVAQLTLFWQNRQGEQNGFGVQVVIEGTDGKGYPVSEVSPSFTRYAAGQWQPGELVRQQCRVRLSSLPAGEYSILVTVEGASGVVNPTGAPNARADGSLAIGRLSVR